MNPKSLEDFSAALLKGAPEPRPASETGQFNVFDVADLMASYGNRPPMNFARQPFYKISLVQGQSRVEYADQAVALDGRALWFATSRVPYRWRPHNLAQTGYFCVFTDEFLLPVKGSLVLEELPVFQPGACPVFEVSASEYATVAGIFEKMQRELSSGYAYRHELLRAYLLELIYYGQKLRPGPAPAVAPAATARLAAQFTRLLEQQFPLAMPRQRMALRTARDFASALAVHVNHLNRVLKEATGHTTTALITTRVAQEARQLLKQTTWTVSEIADGLGFTDAAHFCHFFKRQTGLVPSDFRG